MDKRLLFIIKPAVKELEPIHQPPRIIAEIRLAETEFIVIDPRAQRLLIDAVVRDPPQCLFDHTDKIFFLLHVRILRDHREDRLIDPIVIRAHDILSDPRIKERFFQRSAGR